MAPSSMAQEHPERIEALQHRGTLMGSEHLGRYLWAARLVGGQVVLDAGCGTGYGSEVLLDGGPTRVVAVDVSEEAVAQVKARAPDERLEARLGDLTKLRLPDESFDVVVCFEVIEHVREPELVLNELVRVLKPEGILCISTPYRGIYPAGNEHHVHEFDAEEFAAALGSRLANVALYPQRAWLASTIEDGRRPAEAWNTPRHPPTYLITAPEQEESLHAPFLIALASDAPLPEVESLSVLGERFEVRWWEEQVAAAGAEARQAEGHARRDAAAAKRALRDAQSRNSQIAETLVTVETSLAKAHARAFTLHEELEARQELIEELRAEVAEARERAAIAGEVASRIGDLESRVERADKVVAEMSTSTSWRITAPLRAVKRLLSG